MLFLINHPVVFFLVSFVLLWLCANFGSFIRHRSNPGQLDGEDDYSLVLGATLTLLGLLIGFTFSMAAGRYDQRKNYEEEEANAIGTEYVRADFLSTADANPYAGGCAAIGPVFAPRPIRRRVATRRSG